MEIKDTLSYNYIHTVQVKRKYLTDDIIKKIDSLPPLPESITKIEDFRRKDNQEVEELVEILEKDAFLVSTLLKVANSAMFGFKSKVETIKRLINLLGVKFTLYVAISESVQNILVGDLKPYNITTEDLKESNILSVNLVNLWINKTNPELRDELILPALLQTMGKIILSELIIEKDLVEQFQEELESGKNINQIEKDIMGITTAEMSALIFKHWKLDENFIDLIKYVDDIENCDEKYLEKAKILNIIKIICNPYKPLNEEIINKALNKASEYNLDTKYLKDAIKILEDRALDS